MHWPMRLAVIGLALGVPSATVGAAVARPGAADKPAPATPGDVSAPVEQWVRGLADVDPEVRVGSRQKLMELRRSDLPAVLKAVAKLGLIDPATEAELRDVVTHVYLAEEPYDRDPMGFLGVKMLPAVPADGVGPGAAGGIGVVIEERYPGFCGYSSLRDGDGVMGIEERPAPRALERDELAAAIQSLSPGKLIHLKVLREGKLLRVPVRLTARPADKTGNVLEFSGKVQELVQGRAETARRYWDENFAPVFRSRRDAGEAAADAPRGAAR